MTPKQQELYDKLMAGPEGFNMAIHETCILAVAGCRLVMDFEEKFHFTHALATALCLPGPCSAESDNSADLQQQLWDTEADYLARPMFATAQEAAEAFRRACALAEQELVENKEVGK